LSRPWSVAVLSAMLYYIIGGIVLVGLIILFIKLRKSH
jgi:hypothetical protein